MFKAYGINIQIVIMDGGCYSSHNIELLCNKNIPFLVKMQKNRIGYKTLIKEHGNELLSDLYVIPYENRPIFGKKN
jgi:hypothetical protein